MELKDVASVSGKGGLFKVLKPTRTGVILEVIDQTKMKFIAGASHRVSLLKEISIYTSTKEGSVPLQEVLEKIQKEFGNKLPVTGKSDTRALQSFIKQIVPEYDEEKVYTSDIKKLVTWYEILSMHAPETLSAPKEKEQAPEEGSPSKEKVSEAKAKIEKKAASTTTSAEKKKKAPTKKASSKG